MSHPEILAQQRREHPEPRESPNPVPWPVLALVTLLLAFGVVYIAVSRVDTPGAWGDGRTAAELMGAPQGAAGGAAGGAADGAAVYAARCVACHQAGGTGVAGVFPPLAGSEWVNGRDSTAAAIVLQGVSGPITVKGARYDGAMPSFKGQLGDAEVAAVLTHLRSQWGNRAAPVSAEVVAGVRERLKALDAPFAGEAALAVLP